MALHGISLEVVLLSPIESKKIPKVDEKLFTNDCGCGTIGY